MNRQRFVWLLIAALLAIGGAFYLSAQRNLPRDTQGTALLPSLATGLDGVTLLRVRKGSAAPAVTVHKMGKNWTVAERGEYPADAAKVRKLLLSLADARIVEEKTANPASFPLIGVEDPTQAGATGAEILLRAQDGEHTVIVGKPTGSGNFARRGGESQSFAVEPSISFETEPRFWIDARLLDIPAAKIQTLEVKFAAGGAYRLHRVAPGEAKFVLDGVPEGRKPLEPGALAPPASMVAGLNADDVTAARDIDFSKPDLAILTLADGSNITVTGTSVAGKHWLAVTGKDPELNLKTKDRAFEVAGYRYDDLFRPLERLLVPKALPPATKPAATLPKGSRPAPKPSSTGPKTPPTPRQPPPTARQPTPVVRPPPPTARQPTPVVRPPAPT